MVMIDPNKQYQTRDGRPVRIYAVDGMPGREVHGAVQTGRGWDLRTWDKGGVHNLPTSSDAYDLIPLPDWRDEIPWEAINRQWACVAREPHGLWGAHERKPRGYDRTGWTPAGPWNSALGDLVAMPAGPDDWREALAERPEGR